MNKLDCLLVNPRLPAASTFGEPEETSKSSKKASPTELTPVTKFQVASLVMPVKGLPLRSWIAPLPIKTA